MNLYFKINLNKYGELRAKQENEKRTFRNTILGYAIFTIIMIAFVIFLVGSLNKKIDSRDDLLAQIKKEIKTYEVSGDFLSSKDLEKLANVTEERIFWSKKLVAFSEKTTDKIAITHFSFKNGTLSLFGITKMDKSQKEFDLIDEFIVKLKENKQISEDFPQIQFVKSRRDFEKDVEILRFQIDATPKEVKKKRGRK
jgi:hypothetical protein